MHYIVSDEKKLYVQCVALNALRYASHRNVLMRILFVRPPHKTKNCKFVLTFLVPDNFVETFGQISHCETGKLFCTRRPVRASEIRYAKPIGRLYG
jgi:hypothetical protein